MHVGRLEKVLGGAWGILGLGQCLQSSPFWLPSHLVCVTRAHRHVRPFCTQARRPIPHLARHLPSPYTEQSGLLCQWGWSAMLCSLLWLFASLCTSDLCGLKEFHWWWVLDCSLGFAVACTMSRTAVELLGVKAWGWHVVHRIPALLRS